MPAEDLLERMIRDYGDALLRTCYLYLKDYHLAEDAVQETFIKAMKHYGGFRHRSDDTIAVVLKYIQHLLRAGRSTRSGRDSDDDAASAVADISKC